MKKPAILLVLLMVLTIHINVSAQTADKSNQGSATSTIEAYYFHNTARCVTCKAVESEARADLESLYGKNVTFQSLNLEEEATRGIAEKLEISGQTLLIVKGNKKVNLTNEGFLYAKTNPAKFKKIIKEKVDRL